MLCRSIASRSGAATPAFPLLSVEAPQIIAALVHEEEKARMTTAITRLQTQGLLLTPSSSAPPASPEVEPIQVQGKPLSEVIMEERR
jgi:hypothetical protein